MKKVLIVGLMLSLLSASAMSQAAVKKKKIIDRTPPKIVFSTQDVSLIISASTQSATSDLPRDVPSIDFGAQIFGIATDNMSGLNTVSVSFKACRVTDYDGSGKATCGTGASPGFEQAASPCNVECVQVPTLSCSDGALRRKCTWQLYPPPYPGVYIVTAKGSDKARNKAVATAINILVI